MIVHVIAKGNYFKKYGDALAHAFLSTGHEVIRFEEDTYEVPPTEADLHIVISPNVYNNATIRPLRGKKVAILTEQLPQLGYPASHFVLDRLQQFQRDSDVYDLYVEWSEMNGEFLKQKFPELNLIVFPHGFIDSDVIHVPTDSCDWDLCFFGSLSGRRQDLLDRLKSETDMRIFPQHEDVWGKEKYDIMRRSVVVLNMHFADFPPCFEAHRFFDVLSVGRPVVSEKMNGVPEPFLSNGLRDSMFLYDDLFEGIKTVLNKSGDMLDVIGSNLRFVGEHRYPMQDLVRLILQHINKPAAELEVYY
jgi:hypothetical protein